MTNGIIRNKTTGLEIPVKDHDTTTYDRFWATIDGDITRQWNSDKWEYIPATPSLREQFDALPIGAAFVEDESFLKQGGFYIKVSTDGCVFTNNVITSPEVQLFDKITWGFFKNLYRKEIK